MQLMYFKEKKGEIKIIEASNVDTSDLIKVVFKRPAEAVDGHNHLDVLTETAFRLQHTAKHQEK
jgi:hypothetical protein